MMIRILSIALFFCFLFPEALALAGPYERPKVKLPDPMGYVSDHAKVLEDDWRTRIRSVAQDLEHKTGVEMVVVTVLTIKPFPSANDYATAIYEKWGIGSTQQEHGILILLAVEERQAAMTLGRQMLPVITPTVMSQIGSEYLHPAVDLGHFGEGLYRTVVALATHSQDIRVGTASRTHYRSMGFGITLFTSLSAIAFFWWISRPDLRHPYRRIQRGEYWGTGQGGFGSNWGGFGGGTSGEGYR